MEKKVLVCEDETAIRDFIVINLRRNGFYVIESDSGEEALRKYDEEGGKIDIALLDVMLPGIDGFEVCKEIRARNKSIGIIMLSAKSQEVDKVTGLTLGADDYIAKPFSPSELIARLDALGRRVAISNSSTEAMVKESLTSGDFTLNLINHELNWNGRRIELTQTEFQLLEFFFQNPGIAFERSRILQKVWGETYSGEEKIVDVNIRRLRIKVEEDPSSPKNLLTVWGMGYKWEKRD
ncbi:MAG: response regulator transcription factor [Oscillospiraceae bacterium]|nr:response regulator transcription factor [Oscillospiraceae bacterium]